MTHGDTVVSELSRGLKEQAEKLAAKCFNEFVLDEATVRKQIAKKWLLDNDLVAMDREVANILAHNDMDKDNVAYDPTTDTYVRHPKFKPA